MGDAIRFSSNRPTCLCGISLYGSIHGSIKVSLAVVETQTSQKPTLILEESILLRSSSKTIHFFSQPIKIAANRCYAIQVRYNNGMYGYTLDYGTNGQSSVGSDFKITFSPSNAGGSTNVQKGQIPALYFVHDQ